MEGGSLASGELLEADLSLLVVRIQRSHSSHLYFILAGRVCYREDHIPVPVEIFTNLSLDFNNRLRGKLGLLKLFFQLLHLILHKVDLLDITQGLASALT